MKGIYGYRDSKTEEIVYIGKDSYIDTNQRYRDHSNPSKYSAQPFNQVLQNNPDRYQYEEFCASNHCDNELLNILEKGYIEEYNPKFNFTEGGDGTTGYKHTLDTRKKMSESRKGKNSPNYGKTRPEETRRKISKSLKGKKRGSFTEEHKKKISESRKGDKHPFYGKKLPEETKKKMSESRKGEKNGMYGKKHSKETRKKLKENHADFTGKKHPKYRHDVPDGEILLQEYLEGATQMELAIKYNIGQTAISRRIIKAKRGDLI